MSSPLPATKPVPSFDLDAVLLIPDTGGVILRDTLLSCVTLDTDDNESTLEFSLSTSDPKAMQIQAEMPVKFKGRSYVAREVDTESANGSGVVRVYCERLWYNLLYAGQIEVQPLEGTATEMMEMALKDTAWSVGTVEMTTPYAWENEDSTVLGFLKQLVDVYGGDLVFDDVEMKVHLLAQGGRDRGTTFTYERGIDTIKRRVATGSLVTRLFGKNADGETIAPVNNGLPYIEDFTWTDEVRVGVYNFAAGITPSVMLRSLTGFLASRSTPHISYEINVSGLLDRVEEVDRFEVLDTIFVLDEDYNQSVKSRIVSLTVDWIDLRKSKIVLGNKLRNLSSQDAVLLPSIDADFGATPKAPTGVSGGSVGYWEGATPRSSVYANWQAVTQSTEGKNINISQYIVSMTGGWSVMTNNTSAELINLDPNKEINITVQAVSSDGVPSEWTTPVRVRTVPPEDELLPPTNLMATSQAGVVQVSWDGDLKGINTLLDPPSYFHHLAIEESTSSSGPWSLVSTVDKENLFTLLPRPDHRGDTLWYRARAVSVLDGTSTYNTPISVTVASIMDDSGVVDLDSRVTTAQNKADEALRVAGGAKTAADQAVKDATVEYATSTSTTEAPTSGWSTDTPVWSPGSFIWMRTSLTYGDDSVSVTDPALLTGPPGEPGQDGNPGEPGKEGDPGKDGKGVVDTILSYALSSSGSVTPTGGWAPTVPTLVQGMYLWTRTKWIYSDSTDQTGYSVSYVAKDGQDGEDGLPGKNGLSIVRTDIAYSKSSSGTVPPSTGWVAQPPVANPGEFVWTRFTWTYSDDSSETGYAIGKIGNTGSPGIPGDPGEDGITLYTWIKYADSSTGSGLSDSPAGKEYIGFAYNKATSAESNNPADYEWSLIRGEKGVPGDPGEDGTPRFTWIKYSDSADGSNMYDVPTASTTYIGIAVNKLTETESTNKADYTWSLFKGKDGSPGTPGTPGVSVSSVIRYYMMTTTKPAKPTTASPSGWSTTEPAWNGSGTVNLFYADKVTFSNGQFSWSDVQTSSTFAGIKSVQATADGKNTIFTQTATPTAKAAGDQWWQTNSAGNVIAVRVWNGSTWNTYNMVASSVLVPSSVGTIQLADGAITAPKITASEELSAKAGQFMQLDVSKLRAGTGQFDSAVAGLMKTTVLQAQSITTDMLVSGIKTPTGSTGDRVPALLTDSDYWGKVIAGTIKIQDRVTNTGITASTAGLVSGTSTTRVGITAINPRPHSGKINVSVTAKANSGSGTFVVHLYHRASAATSWTQITSPDQSVTTAVQNYEIEMTVPSTAMEYHVAIYSTATSPFTFSDASVMEVIGTGSNAEYMTVSPTKIEAVKGNEKLILSPQGLSHVDANSREDFRLGFGADTGLSIRNPSINNLVPISRIVFGAHRLQSQVSVLFTGNQSQWTPPEWKGKVELGFFPVSDRYLCICSHLDGSSVSNPSGGYTIWMKMRAFGQPESSAVISPDVSSYNTSSYGTTKTWTSFISGIQPGSQYFVEPSLSGSGTNKSITNLRVYLVPI